MGHQLVDMWCLGYLCVLCICCFFFFKQKTAYEMRISDWSSDVCSSDLVHEHCHSARLRNGLDDFLRSVAEIVRRDDRQPGLCKDLLAQVDIGAFQSHDQRPLETDLTRRRDDALDRKSTRMNSRH